MPTFDLFSDDAKDVKELRVLQGRVEAVLAYINKKGVIADVALIATMLSAPQPTNEEE